MKDFITWYEGLHKKPVEVDIPSEDKTVLEGFQLTMLGFKEGDEHNGKELAVFKEGLRLYRRRASAVAPVLLQKQLPVEVEFKATLDKGGEYHSAGYITFYASSALSRGPEWVAHAMAHEMGHHLFKTYLSQDARDFWTQTIKGDFGDLDIKELLEKWPGDIWAQFPEKIGDTDPSWPSRLMISTIVPSASRRGGREASARGQKTLRTQAPPTGYANKNPEEAFCETIGLLSRTGGPRRSMVARHAPLGAGR